ncbi:unnamed protein product [Blepharisma stoltei]|uniref:Uncharacterized protein n=1 Tax=Blepharisma stoltei TaxID=1481888 RepID=A0AAU9JQE2_9CILI|nr:unnamed protein product [Blepharisma stoltei]
MKKEEKICMGCKDPISRFIQLEKDPNNCCQQCRRFKSALEESTELIEKKLKRPLAYKPYPTKKPQEDGVRLGKNNVMPACGYIIMVTERVCNFITKKKNKMIRSEIDYFSRVRSCVRSFDAMERYKICMELKEIETLDLNGEAAMDKLSICDIPDTVKDLINQYTMYVRINFKKWCKKEDIKIYLE